MKNLLLLVSLVTVVLLWSYYHGEDNQKEVDLKRSSSKVLVGKHDSNPTFKPGYVEDKVKRSTSFESLQLFWRKNLPLTDIELSLLSRIPAKDFIELYEHRALNGDMSADFFISYLKNTCANVALQKSQLNSQRVNNNPLYSLLLNMSGQCSSLYAKPLNTEKLESLHYEKFNKQLSFLLEQKISFEALSEDSLNEVPNKRAELYDKFRKEGALETDIAFYEGVARIKDAASFNAAMEVLSASAVTDNRSERKELAAWLVTSCASGYPCDYSQFTMNSFLQFCAHSGVECRDKTLREVVESYVPDTSYEDILRRSREISELIANHDGGLLMESYLEATKN